MNNFYKSPSARLRAAAHAAHAPHLTIGSAVTYEKLPATSKGHFGGQLLPPRGWAAAAAQALRASAEHRGLKGRLRFKF